MYEVEINAKLGIGVYKTAKKVPVPLKSSVFYAAADAVQQCLSSPSEVPISSSRAGWDHNVWSEDESVIEFMYCLLRVYHKASQNVEMGEGGNMVFDKVDPFLFCTFYFGFAVDTNLYPMYRMITLQCISYVLLAICGQLSLV